MSVDDYFGCLTIKHITIIDNMLELFYIWHAN